MSDQEEKKYRSPWGDDVPFSKTSQKRKVLLREKSRGVNFLFVPFLLLILAAGIVGAVYFYFSPSSSDIGLEFLKPSRVLVGEPFVFTVSFSNLSDNILKNSK